MNMDRTEVLTILGLFSGSLIVSKIIGALLGDLILGNRKAIIIGGIIQALGAFVLCISSTTALYLGLFLVVLGNGLLLNKYYLKLRKTIFAQDQTIRFRIYFVLFCGKFRLLSRYFTHWYLRREIWLSYWLYIVWNTNVNLDPSHNFIKT